MVRNASILKKEIVQYLINLYELPSEDFLLNFLSSSEIDRITTRIIRVIRFCGFYKVSKKFIQSFCHELGQFSIKGFLPAKRIKPENIHYIVEQIRIDLAAARRFVDYDPIKALKTINFGFEKIGEAILSKFDIILFPYTGL